MIKFFRKIRQKLLSENKFSKYLLYAIGEILLVMIGILLALQVNNWNENRKTQKQEQVLLNQLKNEFQDNIKQLNNKIQVREYIINSAKYLFNAIDGQPTKNNDSLVFHLHRTLYIPTFNVNSKSFFNSRDIHLLQNDSLKNLLTSWPTKVDETNEEELILVNYRDNNYIPFLSKHIQMRNLYSQVEQDMGMRNLIYPEGTQYLDTIVGIKKLYNDVSNVLGEEDFEDQLGFITLYVNIANGQSIPLKTHMNLILEQINESIEN
ncbi:DUF6090 family protein [Allomuricauda sp. d1]|uniref:DUF6090 family protein n=1 Tax=Allomuricauda sp. d1 TaxID=3136725 RepID=UPI0031DBB185